MRIIVCTSILAAFIWLVRIGLYAALDAYGFWPYMAICGGVVTAAIIAAFAWDRHEARR